MGALHLTLSVPAEWSAVEAMRQALALYVNAVLKDVGEAETISMVAAELVENAVKHGSGEEVALSVAGDAGGLVIDVTNAVHDDRAVALRSRLEWLASRGDPRKAWTEALLGFGQRPENAASGGLGLARIACEGGCRLSIRTQQPGLLTVRAERSAPQPASMS